MPGYSSENALIDHHATHEPGGDDPLRWGSGKLLQGSGAGADPTEIDFPVPSGLIAMWHGTIANIPSGWVICDGNNSTPNLLAKFVEGVATAATNPGSTGGAKAKYIDVDGTTQANFSNNEFIWSPDAHGNLETNVTGAGAGYKKTKDSITDIRPAFYDIAFIMKT